jgi:hypothetical protein
MRLRYAGTCRVCDAVLEAGATAVYERSTRTVRCAGHADPVDRTEPTPVDPGTPGASARREHERRKARREAKIRDRHPRLGGLVLALTDDPQTTRAWETGSIGEERLGARLNELASDSLRVLHDRRIPRSRANIDHLAVTAGGVHVIDAKRYRGQRPQLRVEGGLLRPRVEKLVVGGRDRSALVDGMLTQVAVVREVVGPEVPVHGVLCFVESDWPLIGGAFTTRGVDVLWPKRLYPRLGADGPLDVPAIADLHARLAAALPPA